MSAVPPPTPAAVKALVALLAFLGLSGLLGGAAFVAAPDGHLIQAPPEWLERIPFPDFLVPGLVLLSAVGVLPLLAAGALLWLPASPMEAPVASAMPLRPPRSDSTTASMRNWSSTSRSKARVARRMPISQVRPVTDIT